MALDLLDNHPYAYTKLVKILDTLLRLEVITYQERIWAIHSILCEG